MGNTAWKNHVKGETWNSWGGGSKSGMKRIYRYFILGFCVFTFTLYLFMCILLTNQNTKSALHGLAQVLDRVEQKYESEQDRYRENLDIVRTRCIYQLNTVQFMLDQNQEYLSVEGLKKIRDVIGTKEIFLLDSLGTVVCSTKEEAIGTSVGGYPESEDLLKLASGKRDGRYFLGLGLTDANGQRREDFASVYVKNQPYSVLVLQLFGRQVNQLKADKDIRKVLAEFLTEYGTTVFAVDKAGKILGLTEHNYQDIQFAGMNGQEEFLTFLEGAKQGRYAKMKGISTYVLAREYPDYFLCAYYDMTGSKRTLGIILMNTGLMFFASGAGILFLFKKLVEKYLLRDYEQMREDINAFLSGDSGRDIRPCQNPELEELNQSIRSLREGYRNKTERLNKIMGGLNSNIAIFELLFYMNSMFITENMQSVLGMNDEDYAKICESGGTFDEFVFGLAQKTNADRMVRFRDKWLKITVHRLAQESFGIVIDKTAEYQRNQERFAELENAKNEAEKDGLTNLYGRSMFERRVESMMQENIGETGIMILLDMDNFKQINDNMGHPEGDAALKCMADCLRKVFRSSDLIGRLGGDEFAVYMQNTVPRETVLEKLKNILNITNQEMEKYAEYQVGVSIGAAFVTETVCNYRALYECADTALYTAKKLGKNRYYINEEGIRCMELNCTSCEKTCSRRNAEEV